MKKVTIITAFAIIALSQVALVSAANDKPNGNADERAFKASENKSENSNRNNEVTSVTDVIVPTPSGAAGGNALVDCADGVKNHGQYVSCVAKTHPGGEVVSQAARSNIGKKVKASPTPSINPSVSPTPTVNPSITPTLTATPTPTIDPSLTPTGTPTATPTLTQAEINTQIQGLVDQIKNLLDQLTSFL